MLSPTEEDLGLVPASLAAKYLAYADEDSVATVRQHYRTKFMPLFNLLKEAWPNIGLGKNWSIPDDLTRLITDYAVGPELEGEKKKAAEATQSVKR